MSDEMTFRDRLVAAGTRYGLRPFLALPLPWSVHRRGMALVAPRPQRGPCREQWGRLADRRTLFVTPPEARGTVLWLHGGGFVLGHPISYRRLAHRLAIRSGLRVALPRYRLAPEHPFPAAPDDALATAEALAQDGPWWLAGDSAGGNLALVVLSEMLTRGRGPERVVLASPAPEIDPSRDLPPDMDEMMLPEQLLRRAVADYLNGADPSDPRISPLRAPYRDPPPVLIQCARREFLEGDIDALALHLRAAGGEVQLEKATGLPHDYQIFAGLCPAADRAIDRMADFLRPA
ncbi:alpha/beta hydrolase fold domain-containing protein [Jannaschia seohaensis]|uniref:Acetyl esterase/lipase n=1 Tax=Jannaschia seohaensis TaxID=475081 RepID=A0A2Y9ARI0_9RHOB|nr:alpha/beta hydrolase fold domain-containing protein [Jannaschia seohaensis]PWJ19266.1 acetyl esterase/lipase [Jannaschia seohaensis]SSA45928.1 Acetyl esterase/lipase [Jannaschia seohaensis]